MRIGELAMNRFALIGTVVVLPFTLFAGSVQTVTLDVQNMTCPVCPITVKKALERVPGVTDAKVDFDKKTASISFDPDKANLADTPGAGKAAEAVVPGIFLKFRLT
jgi:periplasmic mercuric ion binding protein